MIYSKKAMAITKNTHNDLNVVWKKIFWRLPLLGDLTVTLGKYLRAAYGHGAVFIS
jgi:hypothetical protein